jgi:outer membrane lipoprotein-sorting protein
MKTTFLALFLTALAVGCSRNSESTKAQKFELRAGDMAAPALMTTNRVKTNVIYSVQMRLTEAKEGELLRFAREHPDQDIQIVSDDRVLIKVRLSSNEAKQATSPGVALGCDSPQEAAQVAASWNQLQK